MCRLRELDVIRTLTAHIAHIGHVHIAGNPRRHERDENQELSYPATSLAIANTGYDGYVGQEFVPKGDPRTHWSRLTKSAMSDKTGEAIS